MNKFPRRAIFLGALLALVSASLFVALMTQFESARATSVFVNATTEPPGLDTGIEVQAGQQLDITASGRATYGFEGEPCAGFPETDPDGQRYLGTTTCGPKNDPNAVLPAPIGQLIGRIGSGPWFAVGSNYSAATEASGRLLLLYNEVAGYYYDGSGGQQRDQRSDEAAPESDRFECHRSVPAGSPGDARR